MFSYSFVHPPGNFGKIKCLHSTVVSRGQQFDGRVVHTFTQVLRRFCDLSTWFKGFSRLRYLRNGCRSPNSNFHKLSGEKRIFKMGQKLTKIEAKIQIAHPILNSFRCICKICDVYIHNQVLLDANMQKILPLHMRTWTTVILKQKKKLNFAVWG